MSEEYKVARIYKSGKFECCEGVEYNNLMTAQEFGEKYLNVLTSENIPGKINVLAFANETSVSNPIDCRNDGLIVYIECDPSGAPDGSDYIKVVFSKDSEGNFVATYTWALDDDLYINNSTLKGSIVEVSLWQDGVVDFLSSKGVGAIRVSNGLVSSSSPTFTPMENASYSVTFMDASSSELAEFNNSLTKTYNPYISHQGTSSLSEIIESDASSVSLSKSGILTCNEFVESGELIELYRQGFLGKVDYYTSGDPVVFNNGYKIECFEQNNLDKSTSIMKAGQGNSNHLNIKLNISGGNILTISGIAQSMGVNKVTDISLTLDNSPVSIDSVHIKSLGGGSGAGGSTTITYLCTIKVTDPEGNFAYYNNTSDSPNLYTPISDVVYLPSKYRFQNALT